MSEAPEISEKSYVVAVCLSGVFGLLGLQHFYLGRWLLGCTDLSLSLLALGCFVSQIPQLLVPGLVFLAADFIHTLITTIMLLTGSFRDGRGQVVAYPGQRFS